MHTRFLVTLGKDEADDSQSAREYVYNALTEEGFVGTGRWSSGLCDWFVIGGRWSGLLSGMRAKGRDRLDELGHKDDAMILTESIYERLLKGYEGIDSDDCEYADLEFERCSREMIGKKWIVVVDYHN
jgi:hypothetical protein